MTWPIVAAVAAAGVLAAGWVRAQVFMHSVAPQQPWRTACPHCGHPLLTSRHFWTWLPESCCPRCRNRIRPRPAVVETVLASAAALLAWTASDPLVLSAFLLFVLADAALAFIFIGMLAADTDLEQCLKPVLRHEVARCK